MKTQHGTNPPVYFVVLAAAAIALHILFPLLPLINQPFNYLGTLLIAAGVVMNLWADHEFKKIGTTVKPHETPRRLVTSGPFRLSRHPMYLGMASALLGEAILLGTITAFAAPLIFLCIIELRFIPAEEKNLLKTFGAVYERYMRKVRKWL